MNNKNKNGFLITWVSCIVILLTLCFFGISDSIKGTRAKVYCPDGYPYSDGSRCWRTTPASVKYNAGGSCSCSSSKVTYSGSCTCINSSLQTTAGTCDPSSGCHCDSGYSISSNSCNASGGQTTSGTCGVSSSGEAICSCSNGAVSANRCTVTPVYSCSQGTLSGNLCYVYADIINDGCYTRDEAESEAKKICKDDNYTLSSHQTGSSTCWYYTCDIGTTWYCKDKGTYVAGSGESLTCKTCPSGYYCDGVKKYACPNGEYSAPGSTSEDDCNNTTADGNKICPNGLWFKSLSDANAAANSMCEAEGKSAEVPVNISGNCYTLSCCDCDGDGCGNEKILVCAKTSSGWGWINTTISESTNMEIDKDGSSCAETEPEDEGPTNPGPGSEPSNPPSSNPPSSNPSSEPSGSSKPSSSTPSTSGCYKNKDTGVAKWFESDPDNNSGTDLYEKVANSECEHNITDNPATGQIAMFIVWMIGFASIGYSIYYLMKFSKSE